MTQGIDGTDVRAGLLGEIGSHFTWISPVEERVFRAVARLTGARASRSPRTR